MTKQRSTIDPIPPIETWNEELSRQKKYKEATQKRKTQKLAEKEAEKLKKRAAIGRLKIEP